jgi:hypothetical protein
VLWIEEEWCCGSRRSGAVDRGVVVLCIEEEWCWGSRRSGAVDRGGVVLWSIALVIWRLVSMRQFLTELFLPILFARIHVAVVTVSHSQLLQHCHKLNADTSSVAGGAGASGSSSGLKISSLSQRGSGVAKVLKRTWTKGAAVSYSRRCIVTSPHDSSPHDKSPHESSPHDTSPHNTPRLTFSCIPPSLRTSKHQVSK